MGKALDNKHMITHVFLNRYEFTIKVGFLALGVIDNVAAKAPDRN